MRLTLSLLLVFMLGISVQAKTTHSKTRSTHKTTSQPKSPDLFSGAKSLDERVAAYNMELALAHMYASSYEMEMQLVETATQEAQQTRADGGDDAETKAQASDLEAAKDQNTADTAMIDMLTALKKSNLMIRVLVQDKRLARNYHFGPKIHFEEAYYGGLPMNVREKVVTSPLVANSDVNLPDNVSR